MVTVIFSRDSRKRLSSVLAEGHAGWADRGDDIVCAAVSGILLATRAGLEDYAKVDLKVTQSTGKLRLEVPAGRRDDEAVKAILATAELSIKQIAKQNRKHVAYERSSRK
ncbi:MAG: ribosomal-processing cysteine protease Prp [Candidatus Baltobacteraceae bacterium]